MAPEIVHVSASGSERLMILPSGWILASVFEPDQIALNPRIRLWAKADFAGSSSQDNNNNFGLDRAYINFKWLENGFTWLGKNQVAVWQQNEQWWDSDFQAEGMSAGYAFPLGEKRSLKLQGSYYYISEDNFGSGGGVFNDRAIMPIQGIYKGGLGGVDLTLAALIAPTTAPDKSNNPQDFPGGRTTYYMYSAEAKFKNLPIPVTIGYEAYHGGASTLGHGVALKFKPLKELPLELRGYYYYIPVDSVPLQGAIVEDNFRYSSNFKGFQVVAAYKILPNLGIDFRAYPQDAIDENLTSAKVPGLGNYVMRDGYTTRYQMNLNIKF